VSNRIDDLENHLYPGILKALIIGRREGISQEMRDAFARSGAAHLLAISGLHLGIVAGIFFKLFQWLAGWFPSLLFTARRDKAAALLTLIPLIAYGLIAGMSPSTRRAVVMVSVFLLAYPAEKKPFSVNTLAIAALVILALHPPELFSISFQLSFAAVFWILYGMRRVEPLLVISGEDYSRMAVAKKSVFTFFWVSFFAISGTLPLTMFYFNQVSFIGLAANFLFIPLIGFWEPSCYRFMVCCHLSFSRQPGMWFPFPYG